jgi:hypothetical protein
MYRPTYLCEAPTDATKARILEVVAQGGTRGAVLNDLARRLWSGNPHARAGAATVLARLKGDGFLVSRGVGRWSRWWVSGQGATFLDTLRPPGAVVR